MLLGSNLEGLGRDYKSGLEDVMNEGRPGVPFGAQTNSPVSQPVRLVPPSAGITLRPQAVTAVAAPPPLPRTPVADEPLELVSDDKPTSAKPVNPYAPLIDETPANDTPISDAPADDKPVSDKPVSDKRRRRAPAAQAVREVEEHLAHRQKV